MPDSKKSERLSADEARAKAAECRDMAKRAAIDEHRIMLRHMAETWDRIADNLKTEA